MRFCDEFDGGFGWMEEGDFLQRCSHALVSKGRVWLVDPVDGEGVEERVRAAGEPAGVILLLGRHARGSAALAARLGVGVHRLEAPPPFETIRLRTPAGAEAALWWPARRVLVCADALGTVGYFKTRSERIGVHPFLRLAPPRRLATLAPEHVLVGHGEGLHEDAAAAVREAVATGCRRLPALALDLVRQAASHRRR